MQILEYGPPISLADAKRVIEAAEAEASANQWAMVIAVVDSAGHLVALHKMDHAQFGSIAIAQAKAQTAVNFKRSTMVFEEAMAGARAVSSGCSAKQVGRHALGYAAARARAPNHSRSWCGPKRAPHCDHEA